MVYYYYTWFGIWTWCPFFHPAPQAAWSATNTWPTLPPRRAKGAADSSATRGDDDYGHPGDEQDDDDNAATTPPLGMCGYAFLFSHPVKLDVFMVPSAVAIPLGCWPTTIHDKDDATGSDWNLMPANNFQSFSSHHSHGLYSTVLGSHSLTHCTLNSGHDDVARTGQRDWKPPKIYITKLLMS